MEVSKEDPIRSKVDELIELVEKKGPMTLTELTVRLKAEREDVENWAKILDKAEVLRLVYPANPLAEPYLESAYVAGEKKVSVESLTDLFKYELERAKEFRKEAKILEAEKTETLSQITESQEKIRKALKTKNYHDKKLKRHESDLKYINQKILGFQRQIDEFSKEAKKLEEKIKAGSEKAKTKLHYKKMIKECEKKLRKNYLKIKKIKKPKSDYEKNARRHKRYSNYHVGILAACDAEIEVCKKQISNAKEQLRKQAEQIETCVKEAEKHEKKAVEYARKIKLRKMRVLFFIIALVLIILLLLFGFK